jgi:hypothetical protein
MTDLQLEPNISSLIFKIMSHIDLLFFKEDNISEYRIINKEY